MKVLLLTNILTPYRMALFAELRQQLATSGGELKVVAMAVSEPGRSWTYEDLKTDFTVLLPHLTINFGGLHLHLNRGLLSTMQAFSPDVVICAGGYTLPAVWQVLLHQGRAGRRYRTFFWSESHLRERSSRSLPVRGLREALRGLVYRRFDGFLYAGRLSREFIQRYAHPRAHLVFFPNTIDDDFFGQKRIDLAGSRHRLRERFGVEKQKYVFITPARLTAVKGLDRLLELAKDMKHRDEAVFLVAGSGEEEQSLREQATVMGVDMRLLGPKTPKEIAELYALSDCLLLPSVADSNPLTVVEGLWSGLPLLLSAHVGNHPEAVKEGINGYVFDYEDPKRSTALIDRLVEADAEWVANASRVSLEIARETYHCPTVVGNLLTALSEKP